MATIDSNDSKKYFAGLSFADLVAKQEEARLVAEQIAEALVYRRGEEIKVLADAYVKKATAAGFSVAEALNAVRPYQTTGKTTRAKRGTAAVKGPRKDADGTGASPVPGATYKLTTGEQWTKAASGKGAPKKEFLDVVKGGKTWASLKA